MKLLTVSFEILFSKIHILIVWFTSPDSLVLHVSFISKVSSSNTSISWIQRNIHFIHFAGFTQLTNFVAKTFWLILNIYWSYPIYVFYQLTCFTQNISFKTFCSFFLIFSCFSTFHQLGTFRWSYSYQLLIRLIWLTHSISSPLSPSHPLYRSRSYQKFHPFYFHVAHLTRNSTSQHPSRLFSDSRYEKLCYDCATMWRSECCH